MRTKSNKRTTGKFLLLLLAGVLLSAQMFAQGLTVKGTVSDETGAPIIGANVIVKGTTIGASTDHTGAFTLNTESGAVIEISYLGYKTVERAAMPELTVQLEPDALTLQDVVVIGYGSVKKDDLTGSVTAIKPDEMNRGLSTNAQDLLQGKVAGVSVISDGGAPGSGSTIRIRGGSSLTASNNPLIVIDGFAIDDKGVQGLSNPLSMVNPNDIETFTVLKDASATAIYGSRASNGVILITTKKGSRNGGLNVSYSGNFSVSTVNETLDVMNGDQFRSFVTDIYGEGSDQVAALGSANTDWQDEIYRTAYGTDHNVTLTGNTLNTPFRVSAGYTNQDGIINTSNFERYTVSANVAPTFFDDHLKVNINAKYMLANNRFADGGVVGAAATFDPTQSVYNSNPDYVTSFGGYFQWTGANQYNDSAWPLAYNSLAMANPVATLALRDDTAESHSFIGNISVDYKFHWLPELSAHVSAGMDSSTGEQTTIIDPRSASNNYYGYNGFTQIEKTNESLNAYLQYSKEFSTQSLNVMAGYEWSHLYREGSSNGMGRYQTSNNDRELAGLPYNATSNKWAAESYLVSFFGRANYSLLDKYMLTATVRADGSSKFNENNRWGIFPSAAFAWKISNEEFLKSATWLSDLKLRVGWGMTGQQEGIGEYSYFNSYVANREFAFYPIIGDGSLSRPNAYNDNLTWEKTTTYNAGLDMAFLKGRITSSVDFYKRETTDLLQAVGVAAGSNFSNVVTSNVGSLENIGVEWTIGGTVIKSKDFSWDLNYNLTWNDNEITSLTTGADNGYYISTGGISTGTGNNIQAHAVGHASNSFYVYQQVYDEAGKPIENTFVDRNGDGIISDGDRYFYKDPWADVTMGLSSKMIYKNFDFSFSLRASLNNYVYNDVASRNCNVSPAAVYSASGFFSNYGINNIEYGFQGVGNYFMSDMFVQNASFLKLDNVTLGYSFEKGGFLPFGGRVYVTAQNILTITDYEGIDPEVAYGIDNSIYPRPAVFIVGLNLNF